LRYCRSRVFTFVFFMQKLKGISSGKNNKSCRTTHFESNKIGLEFFLLFCDFLRNLQESGNSKHYWSYPFARRTLERTWGLQCGPWGRLAGAGCRNSASSPALAAGERLGRGLGTTRVRFGGLDRAETRPAMAIGGEPGRRPREPLLRRDRDQGTTTCGGGGSCAL
jgi:hypothetical protein